MIVPVCNTSTCVVPPGVPFLSPIHPAQTASKTTIFYNIIKKIFFKPSSVAITPVEDLPQKEFAHDYTKSFAKIKDIYDTDQSTHHLITKDTHLDTGLTEEALKKVTTTALEHFEKEKEDFLFADTHGTFIAKMEDTELKLIKYNELIGKGGLGEIHRVFDLPTGKVRAIKEARSYGEIPRVDEKEIKKLAEHKKIAKDSLENEEKILRKIKRHGSFVGLESEIHAVFNIPSPEGTKKYLVIDEYEGGDYGRVLKKRSIDINDDTDVVDSIKECLQVIEGMRALKNLHILHLDIKSSNVLLKTIQGEKHLSISDFGGAVDVDVEKIDPDSFMGKFIPFTPEYTLKQDITHSTNFKENYVIQKSLGASREVLKSIMEDYIELNFKIAIFQLGIFLHNLFTCSNASPFSTKNRKIANSETSHSFVNNELPYIELDRFAPKPIGQIIKLALSQNYLERPDIEDIYNVFKLELTKM